MQNSITKALLFVIALCTSIMAVQLIPISRKAYLFNLCRDYNASWNESNLLSDGYKSGDKEKEEAFSKAVAKSNVYLTKIYKELGITPLLHSQEEPETSCQRIGFDWYIDEL